MRVSDFDYHLPEELIAQHPLPDRASSRLLVVDRKTGTITHSVFRELGSFLHKGDTLVFNRSRVLHGRLLLEPETPAHPGAEILVLKVQEQGTDFCVWECMVRKGKLFPEGVQKDTPIYGPKGTGTLSYTTLSTTDLGTRLLRFPYSLPDFLSFLEQYGQTPLPPYITGRLTDRERYQTVYAKESGSSAAPTAGLHFTPELLQELHTQGIAQESVLLHVGPGTFQPVKVEDVREHTMHQEYYELSPETSTSLMEKRASGSHIVAVGTTATRVLESCADTQGILHPGSGETGIFLYPPYQFRFVDHLITNFHLPKSTLLMIVSAFAGKELILNAYEEAIREKYRFFSFGDAMLIL
jgi:S-adenosylmethionine:tRNA ribosyltransferase-isomerase